MHKLRLHLVASMLIVGVIAAGMIVFVSAHGHQQAAYRHGDDEYTHNLSDRFHLGKSFQR